MSVHYTTSNIADSHRRPGHASRCCTIAVLLACLLPAAGVRADPAVDARIADVVAGGGGAIASPMPVPVERAWLERMYTPAQPGPVWFDGGGARPAVAVALRELRAAADRGLAPEDYAVDALERHLAAAHANPFDADAIARADFALTTAMLRFLSDLRFGRVQPQRVEPHFRAAPKDAPFVSGLRDAAAHDRLAGLIASTEPQFAQYARLRQLLADYRSLPARRTPELPALPSPRNRVEVGDRYAGAAALHAELVRLGDLPATAPGPVDGRLAPSLAEGLRQFQTRHGLEPDGVLGKDTLAALNVPIDARVRQILLSLERLRWLPDPAPGPLIAINIPSFELWGFDAPAASRAALAMPVVVGTAMRSETPVFIGEMRSVEFNPYWNVPSGILRRELLPKIARDPAWLAREDMEIVSTRGDGRVLAADVDGVAALRSGDARLRQRPGPQNALGGVKFVLPNTMDIYLHATPARALFSRAQRDF